MTMKKKILVTVLMIVSLISNTFGFTIVKELSKNSGYEYMPTITGSYDNNPNNTIAAIHGRDYCYMFPYVESGYFDIGDSEHTQVPRYYTALGQTYEYAYFTQKEISDYCLEQKSGYTKEEAKDLIQCYDNEGMNIKINVATGSLIAEQATYQDFVDFYNDYYKKHYNYYKNVDELIKAIYKEHVIRNTDELKIYKSNKRANGIYDKNVRFDKKGQVEFCDYDKDDWQYNGDYEPETKGVISVTVYTGENIYIEVNEDCYLSFPIAQYDNCGFKVESFDENNNLIDKQKYQVEFGLTGPESKNFVICNYDLTTHDTLDIFKTFKLYDSVNNKFLYTHAYVDGAFNQKDYLTNCKIKLKKGKNRLVITTLYSKGTRNISLSDQEISTNVNLHKATSRVSKSYYYYLSKRISDYKITKQ